MTDAEGGTPEETTATETAAGAVQPTETQTAEAADLGEDHPLKKTIKAVRAERDDMKRELAEVRKQVEQFEAGKLSDLEKAQKDAAKATERATAAELRAARFAAIAETGLPKDLHKFLPATADEAALVEAAKELMAALGSKPGTPKPDPSQGAKGAGPSIDSRIAEAQRKGDFKTVIKLQNDRLEELARKQK